MVNILDVSQQELIKEVANELEKLPELKKPEWASFVKTGAGKERPPVRSDWWKMRCASVLRKIYTRGPIGVSKLRTLYGGKKNRGAKPGHFYRAGGSIIRKILQAMEKAQLIKQVQIGVHKGRIATPKGKSLVDKAAQRLANGQPGRNKAAKA